jgi:hypothetical protein
MCRDGATFVTYGGMSKHPMVIPYEVLAYKDLVLKGFWVTAWAKKHSKEERAAMINDIADMIRRCPCRVFCFGKQLFRLSWLTTAFASLSMQGSTLLHVRAVRL